MVEALLIAAALTPIVVVGGLVAYVVLSFNEVKPWLADEFENEEEVA
jgi:hypothetical protein